MGYICPMYEVLVFVYEHYWGGSACPDREQLGRRLHSAGFGRTDIQQALAWLDGLDSAAQGIHVPEADAAAGDAGVVPPAWAASADSRRVYSARELDQLGAEGIACIHFLESAGALSAELRELVIDRALAAPESPLGLDDLKIIIMMVYWRLDADPDVLVLDELCDDVEHRVAH